MPWPSDDELLAAWRRLADDPDAGAAVVDAVHAPLVADLAARQRTADPDAVYTAASDALLWFVEHPERYDPARSPLRKFLLLVAERRLLNLIEAETRHHRRRDHGIPVEHAADERNEPEDDPLSFADPRLQAALANLSDVDREVVELIRGGERDTAAFAALLGFTHLPIDDQRREVKRAKDRILARLKRAVGGGHG